MSVGRPEDAPDPDDLRAEFLRDVIEGLRAIPKTIPSKYLYDKEGSVLFDRICELDEYYPTRTELRILHDHAPEMAARLGPACVVIEYGSGSSNKTAPLLANLERPVLYAPIDVARDHLLDAAGRIATAFPDIDVCPIHGDFTQEFEVPEPEWAARRRVVYFPGSTIGNFALEDRERLLAQIARVCGSGGGLLVGADLRKPVDVLEPAYDDREGVTAAFNLNLLDHINRELGADFDRTRFRHRAPWIEEHGRIEMHLESLQDQLVTIAGERIAFAAGETVRTEYSHKFTLDGFAAMAARAGLEVRQVWTDPREWFSVQYCEVR
jgi:dimethylhistidine N-methyltransferase